MDVQDDSSEAVQADKSKGRNTRRRAPAKPAEGDKRSLNLRVDEATYQRLTVHALMRKTTISQLVMDYARESLKEFSIHRNAKQGAHEKGDHSCE
jgi:predicted HicB family RNase H-like nuclease